MGLLKTLSKERTKRIKIRADKAVAKAQAKAGGGYYTAETTEARWDGITNVSTAATEAAIDAAMAYATGGASLAAGALGEGAEGFDLEGLVDQVLGGAMAEEPPPPPPASSGGGAALLVGGLGLLAALVM